MNKFEVIKNDRIFKNENINRTQFTLRGKNDNMISYDDTKDIVHKLMSQDKYKTHKFIVNAMVDRLRNIKQLDNDWVSDDDLDEYFNNKGQSNNTDKFKSFSAVQVIIYK